MSVNEKAPLDENGEEILGPDGKLIDSAAVRIRTSLGEYLVYKVSVEGMVPNFVLVDENEVPLLESIEVQDEYETTWPDPKTASVPENEVHVHTLSMNFTGAFSATPRYTYKVELRRINDSLKRVLIWVAYESPDQEPEHFKALSVETA